MYMAAVYFHFLLVATVIGKSGYFVPMSNSTISNSTISNSTSEYRQINDKTTVYNQDLMVVVYNKSCIDANYLSNGRAVDKYLIKTYPCIEEVEEHLVLYTMEISIFNISDKSCTQNKKIDYDDLCIGNLEYDTYITEDMLATESVNGECASKPWTFNNTYMWNLEFFNGPNGPRTASIYEYPTMNDTNVDIYVIDTGIYKQNPEFDDVRQEDLYQWLQWEWNFDETTQFSNHGTLVASVIIGKNVGVTAVGESGVNDFTLYNVNLGRLNSFVWWVPFRQGLVRLFNRVIANVESRKISGKRAVINCSFGKWEPPSQWNMWDEMFRRIEDAGGIIVSAAGNEPGLDACSTKILWGPNRKQYPAASDYVIGVGGLDTDGSVYAHYGYGDCIEVFAPAREIRGAVSARDYNTNHGTSLASAHITGLVASILMQQPSELHITKHMMVDYLTSTNYIDLTEDSNCNQTRCYAPYMGCDYSDFSEVIAQQNTDVPTTTSDDESYATKVNQNFFPFMISVFVIVLC